MQVMHLTVLAHVSAQSTLSSYYPQQNGGKEEANSE